MNPELFAKNHPRLYHMAEIGSWDSIKKHGLLCTSALLDLFDINGEGRKAIESNRRPESVVIKKEGLGSATIRDNKPLSDCKLAQCLKGMSIQEWYETLNKHVFFWTTKDRLLTLLCGRAYRDKRHVVLTVDSLSLLKKHSEKVVMSRINSGATVCPSPRGIDTFKVFDEWPIHERPRAGGFKLKPVELAVCYSVPDIEKHVLAVDIMQREQLLKKVWER